MPFTYEKTTFKSFLNFVFKSFLLIKQIYFLKVDHTSLYNILVSWKKSQAIQDFVRMSAVVTELFKTDDSVFIQVHCRKHSLYILSFHFCGDFCSNQIINWVCHLKQQQQQHDLHSALNALHWIEQTRQKDGAWKVTTIVRLSVPHHSSSLLLDYAVTDSD